MTIQVTKESSVEKFLIVIMVVLLLVVGGVAYYVGTGHANSGLQKQVNDLIAKINDLVSRVVKDDIQIADLQTERDSEKAQRLILSAKNQILEKANQGLIVENTEYKKQIKLMSDIQVAEQMGKWIGQTEVQAFINGQWHFSLTRPGGEKTLGIFKDRDTYFSLATNRLEQITTKDSTIKSLETDLSLSEGQTKIAIADRDEAVSTLLEAKITIKDLNKKLRLSFLKNTGLGIGAGVIIMTVVFSLVKK
jgi:cell division protein FtsL